VDVLVAADTTLESLAKRNGIPPLWPREPGFATMARLIVEQQVSLESADAVVRKLEGVIGPLRADALLALNDDELRGVGFSRQKAGYVRGLASGVSDGSLDLEAIGRMGDTDATARLIEIRGIGPWTAACYLLFALGRPDVWPPGDRALQVAIARLDGLGDVPVTEDANRRADAWRPFRSVAARMLWHDYLGGPTGKRFGDGGR